MVLTRRWAVFLTAVGAWTWVIWPRFALAIYRDDRSFADGTPTSFLWVHALLIGASLAIGTAVGVLGVRAWLAARGAAAGSGSRRDAEESVRVGAAPPED